MQRKKFITFSNLQLEQWNYYRVFYKLHFQQPILLTWPSKLWIFETFGVNVLYSYQTPDFDTLRHSEIDSFSPCSILFIILSGRSGKNIGNQLYMPIVWFWGLVLIIISLYKLLSKWKCLLGYFRILALFWKILD